MIKVCGSDFPLPGVALTSQVEPIATPCSVHLHRLDHEGTERLRRGVGSEQKGDRVEEATVVVGHPFQVGAAHFHWAHFRCGRCWRIPLVSAGCRCSPSRCCIAWQGCATCNARQCALCILKRAGRAYPRGRKAQPGPLRASSGLDGRGRGSRANPPLVLTTRGLSHAGGCGFRL